MDTVSRKDFSIVGRHTLIVVLNGYYFNFALLNVFIMCFLYGTLSYLIIIIHVSKEAVNFTSFAKRLCETFTLLYARNHRSFDTVGTGVRMYSVWLTKTVK